jgi:hypothetical protein
MRLYTKRRKEGRGSGVNASDNHGNGHDDVNDDHDNGIDLVNAWGDLEMKRRSTAGEGIEK